MKAANERANTLPIEPVSYNQDYYAWTIENAKALRAGRYKEVDAKNIAEELEDMGRREKRSLESHLEVLIQHLLKWEFQSDLRGRSWKATIVNQRHEIAKLLRDSPSLKSWLTDDLFEKAFKHAVNRAELETGLTPDCFPTVCPYDIDQLLDDFWPD